MSLPPQGALSQDLFGLPFIFERHEKVLRVAKSEHVTIAVSLITLGKTYKISF